MNLSKKAYISALDYLATKTGIMKTLPSEFIVMGVSLNTVTEMVLKCCFVTFLLEQYGQDDAESELYIVKMYLNEERLNGEVKWTEH